MPPTAGFLDATGSLGCDRRLPAAVAPKGRATTP